MHIEKNEEESSALKVDRHEKPKPTIPRKWKSLLEILVHSLKGGLRSFILSYMLRGGVSLTIRLMLVAQKRLSLITALVESLFSEEVKRFASMIGLFSFTFKFVSNSLLFSTGKFRKRNGAIAGALAGLACLLETPENRTTIAQQFLMRGLQAGKNALKHRNFITVPHGDTLLFSIAVASIMYAYTMYPKSIPKAYYNWIVEHGRVPKEMVELNRTNTLAGIIPPPLPLDNLLHRMNKYKPTLLNRQRMIEYHEKHNGLLPSIPCCMLHPQESGCGRYCLRVWFKTFLDMIPVYGSLNLIPFLVLKPSTFLANPFDSLFRMLENTLQSCSMLSTYVFIFQSGLCLHRIWCPNSREPRYFFYGLGMLTGLSILVEKKSKRAELAMYVLPKGLQSLYELSISKGAMWRIPHLDVIGTCTAFSIIMGMVQIEPEQLSPLLYRLILNIVGTD